MGTLDTVEKFAKKHQMFENTKNIIAGVSGGADSICMLHMLVHFREKYGFAITVVHIHHQIRGKEADEDLKYVEKCCKEWNVEFLAFHYPVEKIAKEQHLSCEEAGRKVRYEAFYKVLTEKGGGKVAVAHNCDDNSETVLFHLLRGTGIKGLCGIVPVRESIIRPVLCLKRTEILSYLEEHQILYRTDFTNEEDIYTRNKIRNHILPYVKDEINSRAAEHILTLSDNMREIQDYLEGQAEIIFEQITEKEEKYCELNCTELVKYPAVLQKMVLRRSILHTAGKLKDITAEHIEGLCRLVEGGTGKQCSLPYGIVGKKSYHKLVISKNPEEQTEGICQEINILELEIGKPYVVEINCDGQEKKRLIFEKVTGENIKFQEKIYTKWFDYDILKDICQLRTRRQGDYLVIRADGAKKKLKDYFIDIKIPRDERERILLLAKGKEILWVIGGRISESCKVTENTTTAVKICYISESISDEK